MIFLSLDFLFVFCFLFLTGLFFGGGEGREPRKGTGRSGPCRCRRTIASRSELVHSRRTFSLVPYSPFPIPLPSALQFPIFFFFFGEVALLGY